MCVHTTNGSPLGFPIYGAGQTSINQRMPLPSSLTPPKTSHFPIDINYTTPRPLRLVKRRQMVRFLPAWEGLRDIFVMESAKSCRGYTRPVNLVYAFLRNWRASVSRWYLQIYPRNWKLRLRRRKRVFYTHFRSEIPVTLFENFMHL